MKKLITITICFFSLYISFVSYAKEFNLDGKWIGTYTASVHTLKDTCNVTYSLANSSIKNGMFHWVAKRTSITQTHRYKTSPKIETLENDSFTAHITIDSENQTLSLPLFGNNNSPNNIVTLKISDDGKSLSGGA
ncbi:MAG: hypothetical protein OXC48_07950, partial [Endozoicomonadaceae bacterium]|nr:hypothetical protein [Endozoicomonadaceae bacterium]